MLGSLNFSVLGGHFSIGVKPRHLETSLGVKAASDFILTLDFYLHLEV